ncbi:MAG: serine/threonine protein kinase [Phycisphaerales bacterium]|nr:serine/threonine protein kinase [Phycisphaerales bacterium]
MSFTVPGYTVYERLGTGARSTIWLVADQRNGRQLALKRVVRRATDDDKFINQAINDYDISSKLNHPYLRKSFELRRVRRLFQLKELHILMEYIEGRSLEEIGALGMHGLTGLFIHVAEGLDALHQSGYVHTDIKPNNILIGEHGEIKIIDFGQSCKIGHVKKRIQGTPDYIAPEQVERGIPLDQRTDIFNLGATLYWAITGQAYPTVLPSKRRRDGIDLVMPRQAKPPHELNPNVPLALSRLVMDCCQENPKGRPDSMSEVIRRLQVVQHVLDKNDATLVGPMAPDIQEENRVITTIPLPSSDDRVL